MDPITHTLTGLALSRTGPNRWTAHATPVLILAACLPDCDFAAMLGGNDVLLHYHRHITHALIAQPVLALLPLLIVRLFTKRMDWKRAYVVSLLGVCTHPLLDWMNVYGIRLFLPFSSEWLRLDIASLSDAWIVAALLLAVIAPALSRLVNSEIGAKAGSGRGWAVFSLLLVVSIAGGRYVLHQRAVGVLESRIYDGASPRRVAALPTPFNPLRWTGLVETATSYRVHDLNLTREFDPAEALVLYKPEPGPEEAAAMKAASRTAPFRAFLDFAQFPLWRFTTTEESGVRVQVMDLRFGRPAAPRFVATAVVEPSGRVTESRFEFEPKPR